MSGVEPHIDVDVSQQWFLTERQASASNRNGKCSFDRVTHAKGVARARRCYLSQQESQASGGSQRGRFPSTIQARWRLVVVDHCRAAIGRVDADVSPHFTLRTASHHHHLSSSTIHARLLLEQRMMMWGPRTCRCAECRRCVSAQRLRSSPARGCLLARCANGRLDHLRPRSTHSEQATNGRGVDGSRSQQVLLDTSSMVM